VRSHTLPEDAKAVVQMTDPPSSDAVEYRSEWRRKRDEIQHSAAFRELSTQVDHHLRAQTSKGAAYRLLRRFEMAAGLSLTDYRRNGFILDLDHIPEALHLLDQQSSDLIEALNELDRLRAKARAQT
jgi:hypothetical protein